MESTSTTTPTVEEFRAELGELVAVHRPRLFAVCEEIGVREDGFVRCWGLDFGDAAEVFAAEDGRGRARFRSVDAAVAHLTRHDQVHLIWADEPPAPAGSAK
ncbi:MULTISPECIES: hypothetical protein [unclassified Saccharopolyspora]|uniref:hypothetical protein n=1 Tax=unclassified Saccharopolyspora TaxID=2646250 RepID=UPI001CD797FF|nr:MULTISPECIES: hypothetical protein [unclassified Saccharopolyspora]MCA1187161.1 hypothetical protein [Saccharopolyspora sp. 6T]MCA1193731.1 hypothetical protein [Saccharopolyspora sp. 6V]